MQNCAVDAADLNEFGAYTDLFGVGPDSLLSRPVVGVPKKMLDLYARFGQTFGL